MTSILSPLERSTFAAIADYLIPQAEGMPSATQVEVHGPMLDRILSLRPDLQEAFRRGIAKCVNVDATEASNSLNLNDPEAMTAIGLVASAAYYMAPSVRSLIGYPGQESRGDPSPDATPPYVENGLLQKVIDRGPIYKPTPR
jgi:hypothetical protein